MKTSFQTLLSSLAAALVLTIGGTQGVYAQTAAAAAQPAAANGDAAIAAKLKGEWTGRWTIGNFGGKFVLLVTGVEGNTLKGEGHWYGTAAGNTKEALTKAVVENGELVGAQQGGTTFKLKLKDDKTLEGSWELTGYTGPLTATRD